MRELLVVDVSDPRALVEPLSAALFEGGPAILPRPGGAKLTATAPLEVPDDVAVVIETSGTTGAPKRVALTAEALVASARSAEAELGGPGQWLAVLPVHYIAGLQVVTRSLLSGQAPLWLHPHPFSTVALATEYSALVDQGSGGPLFTAMVPAQLQRILDDVGTMPRLDEMMRGFSRILVGGQSIPADLVERSENAGYHVTKTYGSAETSGGCVWDQRPIGDVVVQEIEGRLAVSGPVLAHSYLDNEAKTRDSFREIDGVRWYLTDDAGSVDEHGRVHVRGRLDDVIVSGGVKIALGAIENLLHNQLGVTDAVVVGAVNDQWGHVPVVVTTRPLDLAVARTIVGSELGVEARPHRIVKLAEIPLLGSGKPDRLAITELVGRGSHA
jgi:o-succinylbenzoate---CoA ligase